MKFTLFIVSLALLSLFPIIYVGKKHFEGTVTSNTYYKGLDYDKSARLTEDIKISWGKVNCLEKHCQISVLIDPLPDNETLIFCINRPLGKKELITKTDYSDGLWLISFEKEGTDRKSVV